MLPEKRDIDGLESGGTSENAREEAPVPGLGDAGKEALDEVLVAELLALAQPYQRWCRMEPEESGPEPDVARTFAGGYPTVRDAFPTIERIVESWKNDEAFHRRAVAELAARVATGDPERDEDDGMIDYRIDHVVRELWGLACDEIEREAVKPFDALWEEAKAALASPDSPARRGLRAALERRLAELTREKATTANLYGNDEPWTYDPADERVAAQVESERLVPRGVRRAGPDARVRGQARLER